MTQAENIAAIQALMRTADNFIITGHQNPDGDAVGACYALGLALEQLGKRVKVVLEPYAMKLSVIPGRHLLYTGDLNALSVGVLFCLDCADPARLGSARILLEKTTQTVCVDHHITNTGFARFNNLDGDASSTSEMVYRLLSGVVTPDKAIAAAIYAGMVSDTGGFRHNATSPETLRIAGDLMETGIAYTDIYNALQHLRSFAEVKRFGRILEISRLCCDGRVAYACVTKEMLSESDEPSAAAENATAALDLSEAAAVPYASGKDLDGVVEYLLDIRGVAVSVLIYPKKGEEIKVSMRSRGVDVGRIAAALGGGGHTLAAGCSLFGDMETIAAHVLAQVEQAVNAYV